MSLKLQSKNALFKLLEVLPSGAGFAIYHHLQKLFSGDKILQKIKSTESSYSHFAEIAKKLKISIEGKHVMEIGSGWLPLMPYHFLLRGGAKQVFTYDINKHYSSRSIKKLNEIYKHKLGVDFEVQPPFSLPEKVRYFPNTNLSVEAPLKADVVFSRFVLEHVNLQDMYAIHQNLKKNLEKGSYIFHFISPSDHRAYVDKNLSLQDFLRYSEQEWRRRCTQFDYHNRLRLPQYLELFNELGFEVIYVGYDSAKPGSPAFQKFKKLNLHEDFKKYSDEELTAGSINIVLRV